MGKTKIKTIEAEEPKEEQVETPVVEAAVEEKETKKAKEKVSKRAKKKTVTAPKYRSKKYKEAATKVDPNIKYPLNEAIKLTEETSYSKFPGTIEAHIGTSVKNIRGLASLPYAAGKKIRILAFGKGSEESGADVVGTEEIITEIEKGNISKVGFDIVVTTPDWMPKLAKIAKILGPRNLMPNPKNGTITENLAKAVADLQQGKVEYKTQANSQVIHLSIGKTQQPAEEIAANIKALYITIGKSKVKKLALSSTMGPGVKVDLQSI